MKAKKIHKYLGIPLCFLLFLAALSGIILNHRDLLQSIDIPRAVLPATISSRSGIMGLYEVYSAPTA